MYLGGACSAYVILKVLLKVYKASGLARKRIERGAPPPPGGPGSRTPQTPPVPFPLLVVSHRGGTLDGAEGELVENTLPGRWPPYAAAAEGPPPHYDYADGDPALHALMTPPLSLRSPTTALLIPLPSITLIIISFLTTHAKPSVPPAIPAPYRSHATPPPCSLPPPLALCSH